MKHGIFAIAVCALLALSGAAAGQSINPIWLGGTVGFGTYSMSDLNKEIGDFNTASGFNMDEISNGIAYGVTAGIGITSAFSFGIGWERVNGSSEIGDATGSLEYSLPADAFYGIVQYTIPSMSPLNVGFGALAGWIGAAGDVTVTVPGLGAASGDVSGSGTFFEGRLIGDYHASPSWMVSPSIGYRYAKIGEFEVANNATYNADGSRMSLDYSGVTLRLALKFVIN